jgi:secernin
MCDTFVSIVPGKKGHSVFFGKNSDREPNEAQALEYHPARSYSLSDKVHCTYMSIPQVRQTLGVILSRPFWMWGAEMGANEKGVVIGNEAVFTKMPYKKSGGLTGMDLLRLALERSESAEQALEQIVSLLSDWGQGGICGYKNKNLMYHNSFLIADHDKAWVLETAGDLWVAKKVTDHYAISNGLTIGADFDRVHPDLIESARNKRLLKKGGTFHFANCYSDWLYTTFSASAKRQACTSRMLDELQESKDIKTAFNMLRNHKVEPYDPSAHMLQDSICAHGGNSITRNAGTTGSLIAHLRKNDNIFWATATSAPCTSFFKPVWFEGEVLPDLGSRPKGRFNSKSYWWYHERFHRTILKDFSRMDQFKPERDKQESSFIKYAYRLKSKERFTYSAETFKNSRERVKKWWNELKHEKVKSRNGFLYQQYWKKQDELAEVFL